MEPNPESEVEHDEDEEYSKILYARLSSSSSSNYKLLLYRSEMQRFSRDIHMAVGNSYYM